MPVENITFTDININAKTGFNIKEARRIEFHNVQVNTETGPSIKAENVKLLEVDGVKSFTPHAGIPILDFTNVEDVFVYDSFSPAGTDIYLRLKGDKTKGITLDGNNFKNVKTPVVKGNEITEIIQLEQRNIVK